MFKKIFTNKKITLMLCAVLILGIMLGVGAKILVINAEVEDIEIFIKNSGEGRKIDMGTNPIIRLDVGDSSETNAANIGYVNSVANGNEAGVGIWQSDSTDVYLNDDISNPYYNVGIGTTNPNEKLEVLDDVNNADNVARIRITDVNQNPELQLQYGTGNNHWGIYNHQTNDDLRFWNGSDLVIISQSGDMNIAGDLTVVDAFTINGVLYAGNDIEVTGSVTTDKIQKSDTGASIEFDDNGNVVITIP